MVYGCIWPINMMDEAYDSYLPFLNMVIFQFAMLVITTERLLMPIS